MKVHDRMCAALAMFQQFEHFASHDDGQNGPTLSIPRERNPQDIPHQPVDVDWEGFHRMTGLATSGYQKSAEDLQTEQVFGQFAEWLKKHPDKAEEYHGCSLPKPMQDSAGQHAVPSENWDKCGPSTVAHDFDSIPPLAKPKGDNGSPIGAEHREGVPLFSIPFSNFVARPVRHSEARNNEKAIAAVSYTHLRAHET